MLSSQIQNWKISLSDFWEWKRPLIWPALKGIGFLLNPDFVRYCALGQKGGERGFWSFLCRLGCHPHGTWFYTFGPALEPDTHCKYCGDDLG